MPQSNAVVNITPTLLIPQDDEPSPEVTVLVPSLDEEITVGDFVRWCKEGFRNAGVTGEVLLVDSSSDKTPQIALAGGARVLRVPKRGLGQAYRDGIPYVRGRFVIMGDADCTYDFRNISDFLTELGAGAGLVMGSRFRGSIDKGAMPPHHRFFGTPVTTVLADLVLRLRLTDIHCGMRAMPTAALKAIDLQSTGWEYASEMIISAFRLRLVIREVPVNFYKDREGRISHVKRQGWTTPFKVGWRTVHLLLVGGADFLLVPPGLVLSLFGTIGLLILSQGSTQILGVSLSLHAHTFFLMTASLGYFLLAFGISFRSFHDRTSQLPDRLIRCLSINRAFGFAASCGVIGLIPNLIFVIRWHEDGWKVDGDLESVGHRALSGLGIISLGIAVFIMTLAVHSTRLLSRGKP